MIPNVACSLSPRALPLPCVSASLVPPFVSVGPEATDARTGRIAGFPVRSRDRFVKYEDFNQKDDGNKSENPE